MEITTKKDTILRGFSSHFAGVFNLRGFYYGSFENPRLIVSHFPIEYLRRFCGTSGIMLKTPAKWRQFCRGGSKPQQN
jgi:hypothetical protein